MSSMKMMQKKLGAVRFQRFLPVALCAAACTAFADVVTNVWANPKGGNWFAADESSGVLTNWVGEITNREDVTGHVAVFALEDLASVRSDPTTSPKVAGLVFGPRADAAEEDKTPTWYLNSANKYQDFNFCASELGYFPLRVEGGSLVMGADLNIFSWEKITVRKEGGGAVRVSNFFRWKNPGRRLEIAEGAVFPMTPHGLAYTDVRVTDPAGRLVLTNYTGATFLGSYASATGEPLLLPGNEVRMGQLAATVVPGELTGTGRVTAVVRSLYATNVEPHILYGARQGRLRLDTDNPAAVPFVQYDFEESLTKDSSGQGRDLMSAGTVARVFDADRNGYVARFTATASSGGKLTVEVPGTDELTGDSDYTISLWAKAASPCANNWPTFVALGRWASDHSLIQFRFCTEACWEVLLGHWTYRGDFTGIFPADAQADWNAAAWHHYVAMREGPRIRVWVDGALRMDKTDTGLEMTLGSPAQIHIGYLVGYNDRFFHGDIDDVRVYAHALGTDGVADLFAGRDPVQDGTGATKGAPLAIPAETRLQLDFNGRIKFGGSQTLAATNVVAGSPRAALETSAGGTLALTGPGRYDGGVEGPGAFAKDGEGRLALAGTLAHTGGTHVKAGVLDLQNPPTRPMTFAVYDFEESLGADASGNGRALKAGAGVTRVWDAERGGYVARFGSDTTNPLQATITADDLSGNTDYTLSVWAKADPSAPNQGTFLSLGQEGDFHEIVFRYQDAVAAGTLVLTHWGGTLDFTNIPSVENPAGAWHHYAATRRGAVFTVYCDGRQVWTATQAQPLNIPSGKTVALGQQLNKTNRNFRGDLDDVRIYAQALDADDIARLAANAEPAPVDPSVHLPSPVLHYAFEDASRPGKDSAPGGAHLEKMGGGTFQLIDSPLGGKALKFDAWNQTYLKSASFPAAIPANGKPFTVSFWAFTSGADAQNGGDNNYQHSPTFVSWGDPEKATIGYMLSYHHDFNAAHGWSSLRCYVRYENGQAFDRNTEGDLLCLRDGDPELRWHHYATVYDPASGVRTYVDGQSVGKLSDAAKFTNDTIRAGAFYIGAKSTREDCSFRGALDEVKVFAAALTTSQIGLLMRTEAGQLNVLPEGGDVTVDAGAALRVTSSRETIGALAGDGTLDLQGGTVTLTNTASFAGTLRGHGTLRLPAGEDLALTGDVSGFAGVVELAGGTLTPPAGTAKMAATFRVTPIDPAKTAVCAGDVEIPDGTALAVTKDFAGPFVTSAGRVLVMGGGAVTLPDAKATGTWIIGQGAEDAQDLGTGDLDARWTVTNLSAPRSAKFRLQGGAFTCTVLGGGSVICIR